jgi:sugar lactone lactonase YvrE
MTRTALSRSILALPLAALIFAAPFARSQPILDPQAAAPREIAPSKIVAEYPIGTFLENLLVEPSRILATDYVGKQLFAIDLKTGKSAVFATFPGHIGGIVARGNSYIVTGWTAEGRGVLYAVTQSGRPEVALMLPEGAFPNGIAKLDANRYLVTDSAQGVVYLADFRTSKPSHMVWLSHPTLTTDTKAKPLIPGANGIHRHGDYVYIAAMHQKTLLRAAVKSGGSAGPVETVAKNVFLDDFAVAGDGTVYGTTHVFDSVLRISPSGAVTVVADRTSGLRGPTAAAFGPATPKGHALYVTNNGQLYIQPPGGPETGRLVRIDLQD